MSAMEDIPSISPPMMEDTLLKPAGPVEMEVDKIQHARHYWLIQKVEECVKLICTYANNMSPPIKFSRTRSFYQQVEEYMKNEKVCLQTEERLCWPNVDFLKSWYKWIGDAFKDDPDTLTSLEDMFKEVFPLNHADSMPELTTMIEQYGLLQAHIGVSNVSNKSN